jgi:hypothetical protein
MGELRDGGEARARQEGVDGGGSAAAPPGTQGDAVEQEGERVVFFFAGILLFSFEPPWPA